LIVEIWQNSAIDQGQIFDLSSLSTRPEKTLHGVLDQISVPLSSVDRYENDLTDPIVQRVKMTICSLSHEADGYEGTHAEK
jgi:hypothetical protein